MQYRKIWRGNNRNNKNCIPIVLLDHLVLSKKYNFVENRDKYLYQSKMEKLVQIRACTENYVYHNFQKHDESENKRKINLQPVIKKMESSYVELEKNRKLNHKEKM